MSSMASAIFSGDVTDGSNMTSARADIRETRMEKTPGSLEMVFSILFTQEAHVIPTTLSEHFSDWPFEGLK